MAKDKRENGCLCQCCGHRYKVDLILPNKLWKQINHSNQECLCGNCILRRLENLGFSAYKLIEL